ncbi:hypothetical protein [Nocardioides sp. URHA0032]|uniref:hypothetical protein n=1 Tax=Nocardioides sp. URHA0032 TaxID=1380388 RepID=UPI000A5C8958|nr:hypothetical protein [Nocardioides sp. URHA0032]
MVWIVLVLVVLALAGLGLWVDRKRKHAGGAGTDRAHGPETRFFDRYRSGG